MTDRPRSIIDRDHLPDDGAVNWEIDLDQIPLAHFIDLIGAIITSAAIHRFRPKGLPLRAPDPQNPGERLSTSQTYNLLTDDQKFECRLLASRWWINCSPLDDHQWEEFAAAARRQAEREEAISTEKMGRPKGWERR